MPVLNGMRIYGIYEDIRQALRLITSNRTLALGVFCSLSLGIGVLILWSGFGIVRETLNILLEGTPRGMKLEKIESTIRAVEGVNDVHDLHVWSIGSETHALSCHISIADIPPSVSERILRDVKERLLRDFRIDHTTIQFEHVICEVAHGCVIPVVESEAEHQQHHHSH